MTSKLTDERIAEIEATYECVTGINLHVADIQKTEELEIHDEQGVVFTTPWFGFEYPEQYNLAYFFVSSLQNIPDLLAEVKALKVEKAQAEAERDVLLHELLKETHSRLCEDPERPCPFDEETEGEYCSNECANADPETCWLKYAQQQAEKQGEQE